MDVAVKGRNISVTEALEQYALEKVERVQKYFDDDKSASRAEVELTHERNPSNPDAEVAEATMFINGTVLKAREASPDMYASIDKMCDKLERQVKRYRNRQVARWHSQKKNDQDSPEPQPFVVEDEEDIDVRIVRTKQFQMKPMEAEEAALQMELLDHDFYVFTSADSSEINVIYRRRDGNYGLIEPAR